MHLAAAQYHNCLANGKPAPPSWGAGRGGLEERWARAEVNSPEAMVTLA